MTLDEVRGLYDRMRTNTADRDRRMQNIRKARMGRMNEVFPELFPDGPFSGGIVANMIDVAARDISEVLAPLPTFNCSSSTTASDKARTFADKRARIVNGYVMHSDLQRQTYTAADRFVTYGFVPAMVEVDEAAKLPRITFLDSMGSYPLFDRWGNCVALFTSTMLTRDELLAKYPFAQGFLDNNGMGAADRVEIVRYHDKNTDMMFMPQRQGLILSQARNVIGKCLVEVIRRPGLDDQPHGQFDDVLAVQVAKSRFALLALEAAQKSIQAPIAVPFDMQEIALGSDAVLRTQTPEKIRRVPLEVPQVAFAQQSELDQELRMGSRYPDARNGQVDGSIVTGKGVQALMSGFDTQVRTAQAMFARGFTNLVSLCLELDEKLFGSVEKTIRGNQDGTPYEIKYRADRDIAGDYTVDVQYGLMAGLDPNRALVFGLQARGDQLISRDFLRRQMPFALNATEEEQKIDVEVMRDTLKQAIAQYAASIPQLTQAGQDPTEALAKLSSIIQGRQKGKQIEDLVAEAFAPQPAPEVPAASPVEQPGAEAAVPGSPEPVPGGAAGPIPPMQAPQAPGSLSELLAGLTSGGNPSFRATVRNRLQGR